jgi:hypothetical protein
MQKAASNAGNRNAERIAASIFSRFGVSVALPTFGVWIEFPVALMMPSEWRVGRHAI